MQQRDDFDKYAYNPRFSLAFLHPRFWGTWLLLFLVCCLSLLPLAAKRGLAACLARRLTKLKRGASHRARVNFQLCFPEQTPKQREELLEKSWYTAAMYMLQFPLLSLRSKNWLEKNSVVRGIEELDKLAAQGDKVILLVPHTWAIDVPAVLLASRGLPVAAMAKKQRNALADWFMHRQRVQYGGRVYDRSVGIKHFIRAVRKDNYLGYYLPDEDLGRDASVFVDFFATQKATLKGLGRVAQMSKAKLVPLFVGVNTTTGQFELDFLPALPFPTGDESQDARMMNACIEDYVGLQPEQYMWILYLLQTRPDTEASPYKTLEIKW